MPSMTTQRTIIRGGLVLTMAPGSRPFVGDVTIVDDTIESVEPGGADELATELRETAIIDARGCIVIPGFVDTHRHMFQALLRGSEPETGLADYFGRFLNEVTPRFAPRDVFLGTLLSARAAQRAGITTVQDVANIQDTPAITSASIEALATSGSRAVFAYGKSLPDITAHGSAITADIRRIATEVTYASELLHLALVTEWGSDDDEIHNAHLAEEFGLQTTRHISGGYPVQRLRDLGVIRSGTTFIHGNGLSAEELGMIADAGANLSVAPAIEQMMGHGVPLIGRTPAHLPLSLSTDVEITVSADMFTQMRAAYQASRAQHFLDENVDGGSVRDVLEMATRGGAVALGLEESIGTVAAGKKADILVLRADRPDVAPVLDPYSTVALQMDRSHIDTVLINGRPVLLAGVPVDSDTSLLTETQMAAERIASGAPHE